MAARCDRHHKVIGPPNAAPFRFRSSQACPLRSFATKADPVPVSSTDRGGGKRRLTDISPYNVLQTTAEESEWLVRIEGLGQRIIRTS
jgi:hypothetical protein